MQAGVRWRDSQGRVELRDAQVGGATLDHLCHHLTAIMPNIAFGKAAGTGPLPAVGQAKIDAAMAIRTNNVDVAQSTATTFPEQMRRSAAIFPMLDKTDPVNIIKMAVGAGHDKADGLSADCLPDFAALPERRTGRAGFVRVTAIVRPFDIQNMVAG